MRRKNVEADRIRFVRWIKEHYIFNALLRNASDHLIDQITMRVEDGHAIAVLDILHDHVQEQRRLAAPGGADEMHVANPLLAAHRNLDGFPGVLINAQDNRMAERERR